MYKIAVSIIIPTYNEEDVIGDCLLSLKKQTFKNFEVIIVDDGSSDKTLEKIQEVATDGLSVSVIHQKHSGPGAARNLGAKKAKGDILVFVDSDMTFSRNFLKELIKPIVKGKSHGTFSLQEHVSNWENVWARCWNLNEGWEKGKRHPKKYPDKQKVFRAIKRSEFEKVGGFTPGGYTDDYSLSDKLGYPADLAVGARFYHKNPSNLKEIFLHAKWVGKRKYKLGKLGILIALVRSSIPFSIFFGFFKSVVNFTPAFFIFKSVYDLGIFVGIIEYLLKGKGAK